MDKVLAGAHLTYNFIVLATFSIEFFVTKTVPCELL